MARLARWSVVMLVIAVVVWSGWIEPASLRITEHHLAIARWPRAQAGLRIAVLSDLHVGSPFNGVAKLAEIVRRTNEAHPDVILIAGDLVIHGVVGGTPVDPETIAPALGELSAPLGVYAVLGNHDWWLDAARVARALGQAGVPVIDDRAVKVTGGRFRFWLVGVSDFWEGAHDAERALTQVTDADPVLLLTHNPDLFPAVPARVSLTIAGHTHGGQVFLPFVGRPIVPSRYGERFAIGHIVEDGRDLFVSPGLGTSIVPVRFRVPPEISLLDLVDGSTVAVHGDVGL